MQDIKIIRKQKTTTKSLKPKTTAKHITIYLGVLLTLFITVGLYGDRLNRTTDYGITWRYGQTSKLTFYKTFTVQDGKKDVKAVKPLTVVKKTATKGVETYKQLIKEHFPEEPKTMLAIAKEESGLNPNAESYNCRYKLSKKGAKDTVYDNLTHTYINLGVIVKKKQPGYVSTWCRPGDQKYGWSKDSGLFGINSVHTDEKMTPLEQVQLARKIYDTEGKNAWVSYKTGRYEKHLE